jgi:hypothetical protein
MTVIALTQLLQVLLVEYLNIPKCHHEQFRKMKESYYQAEIQMFCRWQSSLDLIIVSKQVNFPLKNEFFTGISESLILISIILWKAAEIFGIYR